jgi:hypothetical protein
MLFSADVFLLMLMSSLYFVIFLVKSSTALLLRGPFTVFGMIAFMLNYSININSLPAIDAHERQLLDKLLWGLVISTIFVRC